MNEIHKCSKFELPLVEQRSSELGHSSSKPESIQDLVDNPLLDFTTHESYISGEWRTVQPAAKFKEHSTVCLLVLCFTFHPKSGRRFTRTKLACSLQNHAADPKPVLYEIYPKLSYGDLTTEEKDKNWSLSLQVAEPTGHTSAGVDTGRGSSRTAKHYMVVKGSKRGSPSSMSVWDLEENKDSQGGIPHTFLVAMVVSAERSFLLKVEVSGNIVGGATSIPRPFKTGEASMWRIDPTRPKGYQYDVVDNLGDLSMDEWFSGSEPSSQTMFAGILARG